MHRRASTIDVEAIASVRVVDHIPLDRDVGPPGHVDPVIVLPYGRRAPGLPISQATDRMDPITLDGDIGHAGIDEHPRIAEDRITALRSSDVVDMIASYRDIAGIHPDARVTDRATRIVRDTRAINFEPLDDVIGTRDVDRHSCSTARSCGLYQLRAVVVISLNRNRTRCRS